MANNYNLRRGDAGLPQAAPVDIDEPIDIEHAGPDQNDLDLEPAEAFGALGAEVDVRAEPRRKPMKFPKYVEGISLRDYMAAVRQVTAYNRWNDQEGAMQLRANLEGKALRLSLAHPESGLAELEELFVTRFAEEKSEAWNKALDLKWSKGMLVEDLGDEVRRLTQLAYPDLRPVDRDQQAVSVFTRALDQPTVTFQIELNQIQTLREAVHLAKRMDACRKRRPAFHQGASGSRDRPALRILEGDSCAESSDGEVGEEDRDDPVTSIRAELAELRTAMLTNRSSVSTVECHRCKGNHFVRGCPQGYSADKSSGGGRNQSAKGQKPAQVSKSTSSATTASGNA
jgi:hypothetical protein